MRPAISQMPLASRAIRSKRRFLQGSEPGASASAGLAPDRDRESRRDAFHPSGTKLGSMPNPVIRAICSHGYARRASESRQTGAPLAG